MNKMTQLQKVDLVIGIGFALMLIPIWIRLGNDAYTAADHLGHFADILAVIAALYAGRTAFLDKDTKSESPEQIFWTMGYLLTGYGLIKCWAFIDKGLSISDSIVLAEFVLLALMAAFVAPFSWLAFKNAISEERNVFFRILFAVIAPVAFLIIVLRVIVDNFR